MTDVVAVDGGLDPLPDDGEFAWELGGLTLGEDSYGVVSDEGLEGFETDTQDQDGVVDGSVPGTQRLSPRAVALLLSVCPDDAAPDVRAEAMRAAMSDLSLVLNPLPDRNNGLRALRFQRRGEPAKRLYYRAANGQALSVAGDEARIKYDSADVEVRLECPNPVIVSDTYTDYAFTAGQTRTITNAGTFAAILPTAWRLSADTTVRLQNLTYGEDVTFPATASLTVTQRMEITAHLTYGLATFPNGALFGQYPILHPGANSIKASAACTLRVWSTWI